MNLAFLILESTKKTVTYVTASQYEDFFLVSSPENKSIFWGHFRLYRYPSNFRMLS
jgi:hypothetical protein